MSNVEVIRRLGIIGWEAEPADDFDIRHSLLSSDIEYTWKKRQEDYRKFIDI